MIGCDVERIVDDIWKLQTALNHASVMNIPTALITGLKDDLQTFLTDNPVLGGTLVFLGPLKIAQAQKLVDQAQGILDKLDSDVEIRALPFDANHRVLAPFFRVHFLAKNLLADSSACTAFKIPVEFASFI
jgi:hypothetical protein